MSGKLPNFTGNRAKVMLRNVIGAIILFLLLMTAILYVVAKRTKNKRIKNYADVALGCWVISDVAGIILAFLLGWFK